MEANEIWDKAKEELKSTVPTYSILIEPLEVASFDGSVISLVTPHALSADVIKSKHNSSILQALKNAYGHDIGFTINYDLEFGEKYKKELTKQQRKKHIETKESDVIDNLAQMQSSAKLNLKYKFSNFVVGENNKAAHAVAMMVAQNPAKKYNPFFIYGASGLGKTHLMQAIGHYVIFNKPELKVKYIKTEEYVVELIDCLNSERNERSKRMNRFRQKFKNVDVLLIDDIQFLESKKSTMEEMFYTFDYLYNRNKQIVLTSDRLPKDIPTLPDRLRTRFEMGIVVDITPPAFETRVEILKNLAKSANVETDFSVLEYIAKNYINNVRELEGAFNKVSAFADIEKKPLTLDFAKSILQCEEKSQEISLNTIVKQTAKYFDVTLEDILSPARSQKVSNARQIAVYIARELTNNSFETIADFVKKKHPTILYSYEKIKKEIKTDKTKENDIEEIIRIIKSL